MKKNALKKLLHIPDQKSNSFTLKEIYVCFEKDFSFLQKHLKFQDYNNLIRLYASQDKDINRAIIELTTLKKLYPHCSEIYNLLSYYYIKKKRLRKANNIIRENYEKNPTNLLAKINYADLLLRKKDLEAVEKIFENTYDLRELYPNRKVFYISEFRGFMVLMSFLYLYKKERDRAEHFHYLAAVVDKDHPQVKFLGYKLFYKPFYIKIYDKIIKK